MTERKGIAFLLILMVLCLIFSGCGNGGQKQGSGPEQIRETGDSTVELNQRQKEILEAEGLPTVYEDLEDSQKRAIRAIEEMLSEVEQKYNTEFIYLGYVPNGVLEDEQLRCFEKGSDETYVVTVTRKHENSQYVYEDDFPCVKAVPKYEAALSEVIETKLKEGSYKVVSEISELYEDKTDADILEQAAGYSQVVIDGGEYSKTEIKEIVDSIFAVLKDEKKLSRSMIRIYLVSHENFEDIERETLDYVLDQNGYLFRAILDINSDGKAKVSYKEKEE